MKLAKKETTGLKGVKVTYSITQLNASQFETIKKGLELMETKEAAAMLKIIYDIEREN